MRESGQMIKPMAMGYIIMLMGLFTVECGEKTCRMDKDMKNGLMDLLILAPTIMVRNKVLDYTNGVMVLSILESGMTIKSTEQAFIPGLMEEYIKVSGFKII
jgi:hypothetical protein